MKTLGQKLTFTALIVTTLSLVGNSHALGHKTFKEYSAYCENSGGVVEKMPAEYGTSSGLEKGEAKTFCNFFPDNGFVAIGLETFASDKPSIASTYIKRFTEISLNSSLWKGNNANPSQNVCRNIGGASISFVANGGFANKLGQSDICVFGDGSMVSAWSLIYMANHRDGYDTIKNLVKAAPLNIRIPT